MLVPDNIHPENTIYYNGAIVLDFIQKNKIMSVVDLYLRVVDERNMSISVFILSLDWLFLIDVIRLNEKYGIELCF
jgi:hypothetical protein